MIYSEQEPLYVVSYTNGDERLSALHNTTATATLQKTPKCARQIGKLGVEMGKMGDLGGEGGERIHPEQQELPVTQRVWGVLPLPNRYRSRYT